MSSPERWSSLAGLKVNEHLFNIVTREIRNNKESAIPQPVLIIGEEGSGKTTLLNRIFNSEICQEKSKVWIDGRFVFSSDYIISKVHEAKASIVFVDDMDFFFTRCSYDDQYRLRGLLYNEGAPMLIGSVSKVMPALVEYKAPFFEGLKNVYVYPVPLDEITKVFDSGDMPRVEVLRNLLPETIGSLEIIHDIICLNAKPENDINILISRFSDRYWHIYSSLPTNSQHILNAFGSGIPAMTIPELREKTGLPTNILTAYLKILDTLRIIRVDRTLKRNRKYSIRYRLFQLWLKESIAISRL